MRVLVRIDLSVYELDTLKVLYKQHIISRSELIAELKERGCDGWIALQIARDVA